MSLQFVAQLEESGAIKELGLLEKLCYDSLQGEEYISILDLLFAEDTINSRQRYISRTISLAVALKCRNILDYVADQMAAKTSCHEIVVRTLIEEYCELGPEYTHFLSELVDTSPWFACQFITSLTSTYKGIKAGKLDLPPSSLLKIVGNWITSNPQLCFMSLERGGKVQGSASPYSMTEKLLGGLIRWVVLVPLSACPHSSGQAAHSIDSILGECCRLHLSILMALHDNHPKLECPSGVCLDQFFHQLAVDLTDSLREEAHPASRVDHLCLDRLIQVLLAVGQVNQISDVVQTMIKVLPDSRQMKILQDFISRQQK